MSPTVTSAPRVVEYLRIHMNVTKSLPVTRKESKSILVPTPGSVDQQTPMDYVGSDDVTVGDNTENFSYGLPDLLRGSRRKIELLLFGLLIAVVTLLFVNPGLVDLGNWGYLSAFLINGVSTATILLPAPGFAAVIAMSNDLNPFILGVVTGVGATLGSLTAYWAGVQGRRIVRGRRIHGMIAGLMDRFGGAFLVSFTLIAFMPADFASIIAGVTRYSMPRYLVYVGLGNVVKMVVILYLVQRYFPVFDGWLSNF